MDLYAFTQWLRGRGLPESHLPIYRRGAESLLRDGGQGPLLPERIGEVIHALTLDGASPRTIGNLQRIGEALLRFQEEGSTPAVPLPEPIEELRPAAPPSSADPFALEDPSADDAFLPVAKPDPPPGEEAATVRRMPAIIGLPAPAPPPPAAPPPREPPAARAPTVTADLPGAIEEEPVTDAARSSGGADELALDLDVVSLPAPPRAAPARDAAPARPTGDLVRCPKCGRMQPRRPEGTCASCATPFLHAVAATGAPVDFAGTAAAGTGAAPARSPRSRLLAVLVFVLAGALGAVVGRQAVTGCVERLGARPVPAAGAYHVGSLGLTLEFPPGWRHLTGQDAAQTLQGIEVRSAAFVRGEHVGRPDLALQVAVLPLAGGFAQAPAMRDDEFVRFLDLSAHGAARSLAGRGASWLGQGCEALQRDERRLGRCRGVASRGGETWNMISYLVLGTDRAAFAVFGTEGDPEATRSEAEVIVASLRP